MQRSYKCEDVFLMGKIRRILHENEFCVDRVRFCSKAKWLKKDKTEL
jgi:hypothetical protein